MLLLETRRARDRAVDAVGAEQRTGSHGSPVDGQRDAVRVGSDVGDPDALAEVGPLARARAREKLVQPAPLRHQAQRLRARPLDRAAVAQPHLEAVDRVLDDRRDVHREFAHGAIRQAAPAGLVAREARLVHDEHPRARAREAKGRGRAGGPRSDHGDVEPFHPAEGYNPPPWGCARVAKGNGL